MRRFIIQLFLLCFLLVLFLFPSTCLEGARNGLTLWANTIVPTLLPFLLLTQLMLPFQPFRNDLLFTIVFGVLCGYPLGAKLINDFVQNRSFTKKEGQALLPICNNVSPMFSLGYTLPIILDSQISVPLFLVCLYFPNFIFFVLFLFRNNISHLLHQKNIRPSKRLPFETIMMDSLHTIFMIGIYMMLFSIVASLLLSIPNTPSLISVLIGSNEIATGLLHLSSLSLSWQKKTALILAASSFGGLCSAAQTKSVCHESRLSVVQYILCKLFFGFLSFYMIDCIL